MEERVKNPGDSTGGKRPADAGIRALAVIGAGALGIYAARVLIDLFGPSLTYSMRECPGDSNESTEFLEFLSTVTNAPSGAHGSMRWPTGQPSTRRN